MSRMPVRALAICAIALLAWRGSGEPVEAAGGGRDAALAFLRESIDLYHTSFPIYIEPNAGGNHGSPSGWWNGTANMTVETSWTELPHSGPACIRVAWDGRPGQDGGLWNGFHFQAKEGDWTCASCYDLSGATRLCFRARTDDPGLKIQVVAGYSRAQGCPEIVNAWVGPLDREWREFCIDLAGKDLACVAGLAGFGFNDRNDPDPNGCVFYIDDIRYEIDRTGDDHLRLPVSYRAIEIDETAIWNAAHVYDTALAILALLGSGARVDRSKAAFLGDGLVFAAQRDPEPACRDGRLRNAYASGDLAGLDGKARLAGWWDAGKGEWFQDVYGASTHTGNMAWSMLALATLGEELGEAKYIEAAERLGVWVEREMRDDRGAGGYRAGLDGICGDQKRLGYKSTEHNIALCAAFSRLAARMGSRAWTVRAAHARRFVEAMWDGEAGCFWAGTREDGATVERDEVPTDIQALGILLLGTRYARALDRVIPARMTPPGDVWPAAGVDDNDDLDGALYERSAQVACALRLAGRDAEADTFAADLLWAQIFSHVGDGKGIVAASRDRVTASFGTVYAGRLHVGATAWYLLLEEGVNPLAIPDTAPVFIRGDADGDGAYTIGDAIQILDRLFAGRAALASACDKTADVDDDGVLTIGDPIRLLNYLFASGSAPDPPAPGCGIDVTPDPLSCDGTTSACR